MDRQRNFRTESLFSFNFPRIALSFAEFCGKNSCIEMILFMYVNYPEMMETEGKLCGKNLSMEMSLFMCVNSAEMRETEEILRKKT